jgi:hypothetical protein
MYQYVIAFFSTAILTATITKWFYVKKEAPIAKPTFVHPSKIPTLSLEKHNECMEFKRQWALKNNPIRAS